MRTLIEACQWAGIPYPVSELDLDRTLLTLLRRGVRHNLENEQLTKEAVARARWRELNDLHAAVRWHALASDLRAASRTGL